MGSLDFSRCRTLHCLGGSCLCYYEGFVVLLSSARPLVAAVEVIIEVHSVTELEMLHQSCCCHQEMVPSYRARRSWVVYFCIFLVFGLVISVEILILQLLFSKYWQEEDFVIHFPQICPPLLFFSSLFRYSSDCHFVSLFIWPVAQ